MKSPNEYHDSLSLRTYCASHGSHAHDHFQALVGVEGVLELEVEGRGLHIAEGDAFLVAAGERHDFEARGVSRCLVLDTQLPLWWRCRVQPVRPQTLRPLAQYLAQALSQSQPLAALHGPALLLEAWRPGASYRVCSAGSSVAEVARRTGYRSPSALTAALRRLMQH